jgi:hypothetical protein
MSGTGQKAKTMRATLISTMLATALATVPALGGAAYGQAIATASDPAVAEATAKIQDGKADVNGVRYHYLLARGGARRSCCCTVGDRPRTCGVS